ncbi:archaellum component FlaC [Halarchaeum rubridurum]|uniref:Archaellum component FlaC n=1 Tax=Halarchaeum rubridurum TaxID=489911 RepID=A0A830G349_9EURY|nr:hypothetical protein [Halarchaeum rubridurum]MBP1955591.1 archaellum component FlaC [Halarchaeum rubridurum]GGM73576.1 hypothetical protein GCM10009017_24400 [Halarchaeum rubridurum]
MQTRTTERVESWDARPYAGGADALARLAAADFSGVVTAGGAHLFFVNGRAVAVADGTVADVAEGSGEAHVAPERSLALLLAMHESDGETRASYYTNDTPLAETDEALRDAGFTGYVELSENVLSGDYYVAYYGGRSFPVAFVGNVPEVFTGEEAFERAADEVGVYDVVSVDLDFPDLPEPEEPVDETETVSAGAGAADVEASEATGDGRRDATTDGTASGPAAGATADADDGASGGEARRDDATAGERWSDEADEPADDRDSGADERAVPDELAIAAAGPADDAPVDTDGEGDASDGAEDGEPSGAESDEPGERESDASGGDEDDASNAGASATLDPLGAGSDSPVDAERGGPSSGREGAAARDAEGDDSDDGVAVTDSGTGSDGETASPEAGATGAERAHAGNDDADEDGDDEVGAADATGGDDDEDAETETEVPEADGTDGVPAAEHEARVAELRDAVAEREARIESYEERLAEREDRIEALGERAEDAEAAVEEREADLERLRAERDDLRETVATLEERVAELESALEAAGGRVDPATERDPEAVLAGTNLFVRYESRAEPTLDALGEADPEAIDANLRLEHHTSFDAADTTVAGDDYRTFLESSAPYRFVSWVVRDLPFEIDATGHRKGLAELYEAIPEVDRAELDGTVEVTTDDGETVTESFDVVLRDGMGDPLVVAALNTGRDPVAGGEMEALTAAASRVRAGAETLAGAFYVTASFFEPDALEAADEATASGGFLRRSEKESYVKVARKHGYHLCLVEDREGSFHVTVPGL